MFSPVKMSAYLVLCVMFFGGACTKMSRPVRDVFKSWPKDRSPKVVGKSVCEEILPRLQIEDPGAHPCRDVMWVFMARYAEKIEDRELTAKVIAQFDNMLTPEGRALIPGQRRVDHSLFGIVPLELYSRTQDPRYLAMGKAKADRQWEFPDANGLSVESNLWTDDMYMITMLQVQAFRATGERMYLDRAAGHMVTCLDQLQRPNGLFYHGPDAPFFWGRANGWAAVGLAELLLDLPKKHAHRARVLNAYHRMMSSVLSYQDDDGMWHQLIDFKKSYRESSCTAMFAYAMILGIQNEWLSPDEYGLAARGAWLALADRVDGQGRLKDVCVDTDRGASLDYYLTRPRETGTPHGQMAILWCVEALL